MTIIGIVSRIGRALDGAYSACAFLSGALFIALCLLVAFSIAARLFGFYGGGATDIAGYAMASATFLALSPAFRAGAHIYVAFLTSILPPADRRRLSMFAHCMMFFAAASLAFYMSRLAYFSWVFESRSEGADALPLWIPQAPAAFGAILFAMSVLHGGAEEIFHKTKCNADDADADSDSDSESESQLRN